ncbi:hypothetical protein J4Q44_G00058680 [Coregonus suidteri]|uniref:DUF7869 domain-containing protein n=1 Tax=Coregonus suidteri TaxID=861788 RepID=A0AAN8M6T2_9TELE
MQPGPIYFLTPHKCGLFCVCCEGIPQVNYLIDEGMSSSKGSSAVINYMHHFFNYGVGETRVDLNCDNCSGQNKNKFVLWYCAWWTMHKLHPSLDLHFLITGHTKFALDWCFGLIKQCFRKTRVNTLSEIAGVVKDSTVTGQHPTAGWTGGWYGAGGKLWLATTPDSVLQAAATDQAVPALQLRCSGAWCCRQGAFGLSRDQVSAAAQR